MVQETPSASLEFSKAEPVLNEREDWFLEENRRLKTELLEMRELLVRQEKMAEVGKLTAGVAHEINSPVAAINASTDLVLDVFLTAQSALAKLLPLFSPEQINLLQTICAAIISKEVFLSSKEERKLRARFIAVLTEAGVGDADYKARRLVNAGFYGDLTPYLPILSGTSSENFIEYIQLFGQITQNLNNIRIASRKTLKIINALKTYAYSKQQDEEEAALVSVVQNVEGVLALYATYFKAGVDLSTHFESKASVWAFPEELAQVWTNLLNNAMQAMSGKGRLDISVTEQNGVLYVVFVDNGPGVPADVQARIFEPFFTTKERGQGTGLGLDICRKLIEKNKGKLYFESEPGNTRFTVELPVFGAVSV